VLGDPQHAAPVIHLTGTNGKGSTARMITALVAAHGLSVGTYTSPHLERVNERLARNLEPIEDDAFASAISAVADAERVAAVEPSYFDLLTAAAFHWFADLPVDIAVLEVGLLGQWDATNVADGTVAVLTNVGKDHTDAEGDWRRRIAEEKAGIVKPGSTFVLGETDPELRPVFEATEARRLLVRDEDFGCSHSELAVGGHLVALRTPWAEHVDVMVPFHGAHQVANAVLAVTAVEALFERALDAGVIAEALGGLRLPCRFEVVQHHPMLVLDGAHNPDGARSVARTLRDEFVVRGRRVIVLGILGGRDPVEMVNALELTPDDVVLTCAPDSPRALDPRELVAVLEPLGITATPSGDVASALDRALELAGDDDLVLATGSLYTAGDARAHCRALGLIT
jgi:dihydrofolate synthase/folylpolyglutamate synthase